MRFYNKRRRKGVGTMKNMKIGKKIFAGFAVASFVTLMLVIMAIVSISGVGKLTQDMYEGPFDSATKSEEYLRYLNENESLFYRAVVEKNIAKYEGDLERVSNNIEESYSKLIQISEEEIPSIPQLEAAGSLVANTNDKILDLMKSGKWDEAKGMLIGEFGTIIHNCQAVAEKVYEESEANAKSFMTEANDRKKKVAVFQLLLFLIVYGFVASFMIRIIKGIVKPIEELETVAKNMSQGKLKNDIKFQSKDELGVLAESFRVTCSGLDTVVSDLTYLMDEMAGGNFDIHTRAEKLYVGDFAPVLSSIRTMNRHLSSTLRGINQAAEQVAGSSDQMSSAAQGLSQGATEQASSVEELAATINEISNQVSDTSKNAKYAREQVEKAGSELLSSNESMSDMIAAMHKISQESSEIGKIIKTIEDIAFQTNILALNAAVEAARAGEAGKGFAVVADEVRNLASKSAEAAKDTTILIEGSIQAVEDGTKIADQTAQALASTVESVESTVDTVVKISQAAEEQAQSIAEVTQGVDQISSVVQTNSATAQESAAASEELAGQSQILKELVNRFRLKEESYPSALNGNVSMEAEPIYQPNMSKEYSDSKY